MPRWNFDFISTLLGILNFVMGEIYVPPSASNAMDKYPVPLFGVPELMLQKIGYYHHPVLYVSISSQTRVLRL